MGLFRRTDRSSEIVETLANWITVLEADGDDRRYLAAQVLRDVLSSAVMIQHQDRLERINDVDLEVRWVKSRVDRVMTIAARDVATTAAVGRRRAERWPARGVDQADRGRHSRPAAPAAVSIGYRLIKRD